MQELIDEIKEAVPYFKMDIYQPNFNKALEKEKEQIMNAYSDGAKGGANGTKGQHESGWVSIQTKEKYYNQTYKVEETLEEWKSKFTHNCAIKTNQKEI